MAFRSSAFASSSSAGDITATPAGVTVDDYLSGIMVIDGFGGTITVPTSWTQRVNNDQANPNGQNMRYGDKIATGSDNFLWNFSGAADGAVINAAHSGRNTSAPRTGVTGQQVTTLQASPMTVSHTGQTAAQGDDILYYSQTDQDVGTDQWSYSTITDYTSRHNDSSHVWMCLTLQTRDNVSAGATGTLSSTCTRTVGSFNSGSGTIVASIAAAGGGGGSSPMFRGS